MRVHLSKDMDVLSIMVATIRAILRLAYAHPRLPRLGHRLAKVGLYGLPRVSESVSLDIVAARSGQLESVQRPLNRHRRPLLSPAGLELILIQPRGHPCER